MTLYGVLSGNGANADANRYAILMEAFRRGDGIKPQTLDDLEEFLVGTGTPRLEAQEVISAELRAVDVNPSRITEIVPLVRDIGAVTGNNFVSENRQFIDAVRDVKAFIDYCAALNALSVRDIGDMLTMDRVQGPNKAIALGFDRLKHRFSGFYERLRTNSQSSVRGIANGAEKNPQCNALSTENIQQFQAVLEKLHSGSSSTAADLQQVVLNLCNAGKPEREAFDSVMAILKGKP
jgi:hypothetical protein